MPILLILRFIQGAITVMAWSLVMTSALDSVPKTSYGKTMGVIGMAMMLGMAFGAPLGGFLAERYNVFVPMYLTSFLFLMGTLISATQIHDVRIEDIGNEDVKIAMKLGASGIAVSSAITKAKNPAKKLRELI